MAVRPDPAPPERVGPDVPAAPDESRCPALFGHGPNCRCIWPAGHDPKKQPHRYRGTL